MGRPAKAVQVRPVKSRTSDEVTGYEVRWRDPETGKRPGRTCDTEQEANNLALRIERELKAGIIPGRVAGGEMKFAAYVKNVWWKDKLENTAVEERMTPDTEAGYEIRLRCRLIPYFGKRPLGAINARVVKDWLATSREKDENGKPKVSESNLNGDWRLLKQIFDYAVADDEMPQGNPCAKVHKNQIPKQRPQERATLKEAEIWPLERHLVGTMDKLIYFLGALCGLRASEIVALRWPDIDLEGGFIYIRQVRAAHDVTPRGVTKNGLPLRIVPIPGIVDELFREWSKTPRKVATITNIVFATGEGTIMDWKNWYRRHWKPAVKAFGRPEVVFHGLRHTAQTHLRNHYPDHVVRKIIGHLSQEMQELYTHVELEQMKEAMTDHNKRIVALKPAA